MKTTDTADLMRELLVDGKWRSDALTIIILCMEKSAPWLKGEANVGGVAWSPPRPLLKGEAKVKNVAWSPSKPWIDDLREAKYFELLRLGCRCVRESGNYSGVVTFGININFDIGALRGKERDRLIYELRTLDFMGLFNQPYRMYWLMGLASIYLYNLPHPVNLIENV
ncbi:MAG: hypothetical protein EXS46_02730 [Candidatus Taylorbacteria bacterium]|nr:hypothetical protein [Candidatus Taylorbacteria bacterium]